MMKKLFAILAAVALGQAAQAVVTLPFYDGFNYTSTSNLAGFGSWASASGSGTIKIGAANLGYPALTNGVGNDVSLTASGSNVRTDVNFTSQNTNTVYFSFLLKVNTRPTGQEIFAYASSSTSSDSTPPLGFFIKTTGELGVGINTSTPQFTSAVLNVGQVYFVVVGYTFGASDSANVWLTPTSLGGSAPAASGSISGSHTASLAYFLWNTPSSNGGSFEVDEFRIGSTYAQVTPPGNSTPPPTTNSVPRITQHFLSGGQVVLRGTNGPPSSGYEVLCSSNIALPVAQWGVIGTNTFSGSGQFDFTNPDR